MMVTLSQLLKYSSNFSEISVSGISSDSRLVKPGDLFLACKGMQADGRLFVQDAIQRGAKAVLLEAEKEGIAPYFQSNVPIIPIYQLPLKLSALAGQFYHQPAKSLEIVGFTGTNGKTSCTYFLAAALQAFARPCGVIGTLGSGLYGAIKPGSLTTPDAITLQKALAEFLQKGAKYVAMEVSSHSLVQGRVEAIPFKVGVFTNLTRDHLDYHGTMEAYGAAKKRLFSELATQHAVINNDDSWGQQLIASLENKKNVIAYGLQKSARVNSVVATPMHLEQGMGAHVLTPWGEGELQTQLIGQFNLSNVLAVLSVLCLLEIPFPDAIKALKKLTPVPGRMQTLGGKDQPLVVVDYSHTPDSLEKALQALRPHCKGQLYCVFGCGGDRDRGKRPLMAAVTESLADQVIVTDDNPRTESPQQIVADIMQGFVYPAKIIVEHDRSKAIKNSIQYAKRGDCVLIAGKGAETYQQIGDIKIPFSDVEQVREILSNARMVE